MADTAHKLPPGLPGVLAEIAAVASPEVVEIVARAWGGRHKYVPSAPSPNHELSRLVGHEAALAIGRAIGGVDHLFPSAIAWLRQLDARRLADDGLTIPVIARRLRISQGHAAKLLKGYGPHRRPGRRPASQRPAECDECRPARRVADRAGLSDRWVFQLQVNANRIPGTPKLAAPECCPFCGAPFRDPLRMRPPRKKVAELPAEEPLLL